MRENYKINELMSEDYVMVSK